MNEQANHEWFRRRRIVTIVVLALAFWLPGQAMVPAGDDPLPMKSHGVALGTGAVTLGYPGVIKGRGWETVAVGARARAEGWRCTAVGAHAQARVVSATAVGRGAYAQGEHMIAIGRGAYMERLNGGDGELDIGNACGIAAGSLWLGGTMAHRYVDHSGDNYVHEKRDGGDGSSRWDVRSAVPDTVSIHGMDAYDARFEQHPERFDASKFDPADPSTWVHRPDVDVAGGSVHIAAGRGTGRGDGGAIELQTAPPSEHSVNRKNRLRAGIRVDTDYQTPDSTPMLLWDNRTGRLHRVKVGPPDSGGPGFRALVIDN
ncbi:MAG: hypothetical protein CMJ18_02975 [Phycisphaeraceae bacterium]|nr:hypothetical protein [Phycisphaeraceae bacterium]